MNLLVIGAGMMGSAAAYDMARSEKVDAVTLADLDNKRAKSAAARVNKLAGGDKVRGVEVDASSERAARKLMGGHNAALSAVPYFFNLGLAKAAIDARCHFADLGGNNTVVRRELELARKAEKRGVALAPDCGLSPGMASILGGDLVRQLGGRAEALKIYVGGLPEQPRAPFNYQLVFSVEGLINEYAEPAKVLRKGKIADIEPLSEPETFRIAGFPALEAFHTSGGTSTLPETFSGKVGECFEKTLRYSGHLAMIRSLYDLGFFAKDKLKIGKAEVSPREVTAQLFSKAFAGEEPDVTILRVEAHEARGSRWKALLSRREEPQRVLSYTVVDRYDPETRMTSMMRTTAWPASIVVQMMASGEIAKRGAVRQELDVPAEAFLRALRQRGIGIKREER